MHQKQHLGLICLVTSLSVYLTASVSIPQQIANAL